MNLPIKKIVVIGAHLNPDYKSPDLLDVQSVFSQESLAIGFIGLHGAMDWRVSGIVQGLRDAEADLSMQGWASLNDAIAWMQRFAPDHTPRRYRCSNWREVLYESGQFDVRSHLPDEVVSENQLPQPTAMWYRSRRFVVTP